MSQQDFVIKSRFNNFISRFEREQTNVVNFGENLDFKVKIDRIYKELEKYADELKEGPEIITQENENTLTD